MKIHAAVLAGLALAAAAIPAHAVTIDFDDGTNATAVGAVYAAQGVTFANAEFTNNFGLAGSSGALGIIVPGAYAWDQANAITGTFSGTASAVSIRGLDVGEAGLRLEAFDASAVLIGNFEIFGTGAGVGEFFDLTVTASGIKSFRIYQPAFNGGADGVILDNFAFTSGTVPEPASWAMLIAGFGLTGAAMRRRRKTVVTA